MSLVNFLYSREVSSIQRLMNLRTKLELRITVKFNWLWVIFFAFFLAFGYYGMLAPRFETFKTDPIFSFSQLLILCGVQCAFGIFGWKKHDRFKDCLTISVWDVFVGISLALICFVFSYEPLSFSLFGDELSYAGSAHGHSIYAVLAFAKYFPFLGDVPAKYLVQGLSLLLLFSLTVLTWLFSRWTPKQRIVIFLVLFLICRIVFAINGGNGSPHPPLHLLPLFVSGAILGISDFSFKFSYFLMYLAFLLMLFKMLSRVLLKRIAYVIVLAIGTIPLVSHMSGVVEQSFWAFICFTFIFVELITAPKLNYPRLISVISIAALMRQPSFLALVPVIFLYIFDTFRPREIRYWIRESLVIFIPILLFLPVLISSLLNGTPSTDAIGNGAILERVRFALEGGVVWESISSSIPIWWVIFIPFAFLPWTKRTITKKLGLFLFAITATVVYYAINPTLWGSAKYQVEYAAPMVIVGYLFLILWIVKTDIKFLTFKPNVAVMVVTASLITANISLILANTKAGNTLVNRLTLKADSIPPREFSRGWRVVYPYEYKSAYDMILKRQLAGKSFSIGVTYGVLPEIINGFNLAAVKSTHDMFRLLNSRQWGSANSVALANDIDDSNQIQAVIIKSDNDQRALIANFEQLKWKTIARFINTRFSTELLVMTRPARGM